MSMRVAAGKTVQPSKPKGDDVTKSLKDIIERLKYITIELAATKSLVHTIMISLVTQKPTP